MGKEFTSESPFVLEKEGEGRYRVKAEVGYIGNVLGGKSRWMAEAFGKKAGPFRSANDAGLAVWVEYSTGDHVGTRG